MISSTKPTPKNNRKKEHAESFSAWKDFHSSYHLQTSALLFIIPALNWCEYQYLLFCVLPVPSAFVLWYFAGLNVSFLETKKKRRKKKKKKNICYWLVNWDQFNFFQLNDCFVNNGNIMYSKNIYNPLLHLNK